MKAKTLTPIGSLHPVLFFAGVYVVALVFSIFICSTLFYSCNSSSSSVPGITQKAGQKNAAQEAVLALK
jgi:hypothetical protein